MTTSVIDIVSNALCGKEIRVTKYGYSFTGIVRKVEKKAYGFGDVGIFIETIHAKPGAAVRLDLDAQIEILSDEKEQE